MKLISAKEAKELSTNPIQLQIIKTMSNIESCANSGDLHTNNYHKLSEEMQGILINLGYKLEKFNFHHEKGDYFLIHWA